MIDEQNPMNISTVIQRISVEIPPYMRRPERAEDVPAWEERMRQLDREIAELNALYEREDDGE